MSIDKNINQSGKKNKNSFILFHIASIMVYIINFNFFETSKIFDFISVVFFNVLPHLNEIISDNFFNNLTLKIRTINMKAMYIIVYGVIFILGAIPTFLLWNHEYYNMPHWWLNVIFIPLLSCIEIHYILILEKQEPIVKIKKRDEFQNTFKLYLCLIAQGILPWSFKIYTLFGKNPMELANHLNAIWQTIFWLLTSAFVIYYLAVFLIVFRNNYEKRKMRDICFETVYPYWLFIIFPIYFIIYGLQAFYKHFHRIEPNFYIGIVVYTIVVTSLLVLMASVLKCKDERKMHFRVSYLFCVILVISIYAIFIGIIETYNTPLTQPVVNTDLSISDAISLTGILLNFFIIIFVFIGYIASGFGKSFIKKDHLK